MTVGVLGVSIRAMGGRGILEGGRGVLVPESEARRGVVWCCALC